jgi:hypothetical protein
MMELCLRVELKAQVDLQGGKEHCEMGSHVDGVHIKHNQRADIQQHLAEDTVQLDPIQLAGAILDKEGMGREATQVLERCLQWMMVGKVELAYFQGSCSLV